jgi:hypothetical protein
LINYFGIPQPNYPCKLTTLFHCKTVSNLNFPAYLSANFFVTMITRLLLLVTSVFFFLFAAAQTRFTKNQKVEVEWKGKWYKATILQVKNNGYKVHYDGYASSRDENVTENRIRLANAVNPANNASQPKGSVKYGKYNCTASKYTGGSYEYLPKGSFVLAKKGTYTYNGFAKPSTGTFSVDAKGVISFKGGYLDKGQATPMEGEQNRYYLVFPTIPDGRWTCKWIE